MSVYDLSPLSSGTIIPDSSNKIEGKFFGFYKLQKMLSLPKKVRKIGEFLLYLNVKKNAPLP